MKNTIFLLGLVLLPFLAVSQLQTKRDHNYSVSLTYFRDVQGVPVSSVLHITNMKILKDLQSSDEYISFDYELKTKHTNEMKLTIKILEKRNDLSATVVNEYFLKGEPVKAEGTFMFSKRASYHKLIIVMTMPSGDKEYTDFYLRDNEVVLTTVTLNSYKKNPSY